MADEVNFARHASARIESLLGNTCRVRAAQPVKVLVGGKGRPLKVSQPEAGVIEFSTRTRASYVLLPE